jgi:hypothetical protein
MIPFFGLWARSGESWTLKEGTIINSLITDSACGRDENPRQMGLSLLRLA